MNGNEQQMEVHYLNTAFPYPAATECFVDFFEGFSQGPPLHYAHPPPPMHHHHQESAYWSMNMNSYRFGLSGPGSTSHYGQYEVNDELTRMDFSRRAWEYPSVMSIEEPTTVAIPYEETSVSSMQSIPEECTPSHQEAGMPSHQEVGTPGHEEADNSQVVWQDDVDPDNMTYEELLDLGETVGTESRGLSQDLIDLLPTSKFKSGGIFSRKRSAERCVICQMRYRRGDRQIHLPCKHVYHADCGSKWLRINKACPVCNSEVVTNESKHSNLE